MRLAQITLFFHLFIWSGSLTAQVGVLNGGKWAKIATTQQGIFKLTGSQFQSLGFTLPLEATRIQIFGYNSSNLSDKVPSTPVVGLTECAIEMQDGGDGKLDSEDYILFYSAGSVQWKLDSLTQKWTRQNKINNDSIYYFVTLGIAGKRIAKNALISNTQQTVDTYTAHWLYEKDTINVLNSGKQWLGVPMGNGQGKLASITSTMNMEGVDWTKPINMQGRFAASSYQTTGDFDVKLNDFKIKTTSVQSVSGLVYDASYNLLLDSFNGVVSQNNLGVNTNSVNLNIAFYGSATSTGWVDYIELHAQRAIGFWNAKSVGFSYLSLMNTGTAINFKIQNGDASTLVWDVTNPFEPTSLTSNLQNTSEVNIAKSVMPINDFFAVKQLAFETPILLSLVPNQNLAGLPETDYIIITANAYMPAAKKLQAFYQKSYGLKVEVINPSTIYNEFSGGQTSPIAIRNFLKHLSNQAALFNYKSPRYLLLLGIGNFDLSKIDPATQIPVYESTASNEVLSSYGTDDFYGILNDNNDINFPSSIQKLGIAIGRIPARNIAEADSTIEKIIQYQLGKNKGAWRNHITWIADDGDYNLHLQDAESISNHLKTVQPNWDQQKIYLDLYPAVSNAAGQSYPIVNNEIKQAVNKGSVMLNYTGHGNYLRLAEEAVITQGEIEQWNNSNTLPLLVTASCDFAPFDQPSIKPIGFDAMMKNSKGIIGLVSASRLVFAYSNKQINDQFMQKLMVPDSDGKYLSLGESLQRAKEAYFVQNGDRLNAFKFNLMGDPAMHLASPADKVKLKSINQMPFVVKDTIQAGSRANLIGWIESKGLLNESFNGVVDFMLMDASKEKSTLANLGTSMIAKIKTQENVLFRGSAHVVNGQFGIDFLIPKEVATTGTLRMQWYAYNDSTDALGVCDSIFLRPFSNFSQQDSQGPIIRSYINDTTVKNIGWVSSNANLLVYLEDSSGIQTSGNALGQDIQLVIDDAVENPIILNNYYTSNMNTYQSGWVRYTLPIFTEGKHKIVIRAWDLFGNSSRDTLYFEVPNETVLSISHLKNSPNPFNSTTRFSFDRSQIVDLQDCTLEIFDAFGRQVYKTIAYANSTSNLVSIDWDGRTNDGNILAPGVYYYRISVINANEQFSLTNKLIKL